MRAVILGLVRRQPFSDPQARLGWLLVLASIPAGLFGLAVKDAIEAAFSSPTATALFLFVTAGLLLVAERVGKRSRELESLTWKDALWIGAFQAAAVFPGISRSGSTIAGGMTRDLQRPAAARFSFLMSVPIMLAAGGLALLDLAEMPAAGENFLVFLPGFLAAAVVGYFSIRWLLGYLTHRPLYIFSIYCVALGALTLIVTWLRSSQDLSQKTWQAVCACQVCLCHDTADFFNLFQPKQSHDDMLVEELRRGFVTQARHLPKRVAPEDGDA